MSEMDDIYYGLVAGRQAADWLNNKVRSIDAHDEVRSYMDSIKNAEAAFERLRVALRDGRKHIEVNDEEADRQRVHSVNLTEPDAGYRLCDDCKGDGTQMVARMYPSGHTECTETCEACGGEGQVEIDD